jgi:hypothetical protein
MIPHDPNGYPSYEAWIESKAGACPAPDQTLRMIHERAKTRHAKSVCTTDGWRCKYCKQLDPCPDYSDAVAALAILNASNLETSARIDYRWRLVPDPVGVVSPRPNERNP